MLKNKWFKNYEVNEFTFQGTPPFLSLKIQKRIDVPKEIHIIHVVVFYHLNPNTKGRSNYKS